MVEIPEHLLVRSAEAKARATGRPFEEVLAEMKGEAPPAPAAEPPAAEPAPPPAAETPAAEAPPPPAAEAPPPPAAEAPAAPAAPAAEEGGVEIPAHLLERSRAARAKAEGEAPAAPAEPAAPAAATATAVAPEPAPSAPPALPEKVRTQRLLTVVKAGAIQQVKKEPVDKVSTWPHLMAAEFAALMAVTAVLIVMSVVLNAPLLELANFNETPNPSKAPWYFLGLQELLSYFDPQVAGVLIPGMVIGGLMAIPYIDRNPSTRPSDRKFAIFMFTFFVMFWATLTVIGVFFRGPGFNFTYPWSDGVFFDDLLDWLGLPEDGH